MAPSKFIESKQHRDLLPYLFLVSRLVLFIFFQVVVSLLVDSWEASQKYWLLTATLTNIVNIALLYFLMDRSSYFKLFTLNKATLKKDLLVFIGLTIASIPIAFLPGYFLSTLIWGDANAAIELMFGPIQPWLVYILLIAFPVTIALAELATYFGYIMPKLKEQFKWKWLAVVIPVVFLSIQHCALPFIPDVGFIVYRALAFLPFAALIGVSLYLRPNLFIYFVVLHGLMDFGTAVLFVLELQ